VFYFLSKHSRQGICQTGSSSLPLVYILTFPGSRFRKGSKALRGRRINFFEVDVCSSGKLTHISEGSLLLLQAGATTGGADLSVK
jgi:hypothetical protein